MNAAAATAFCRSQPEATHSPSPTSGTQERSSPAGPQRVSHSTAQPGRGLGTRRPTRYEVMPPSVLPMVATASARASSSGAACSRAANTISELPGSSVADRKDEAKSPQSPSVSNDAENAPTSNRG